MSQDTASTLVRVCNLAIVTVDDLNVPAGNVKPFSDETDHDSGFG